MVGAVVLARATQERGGQPDYATGIKNLSTGDGTSRGSPWLPDIQLPAGAYSNRNGRTQADLRVLIPFRGAGTWTTVQSPVMPEG